MIGRGKTSKHVVAAVLAASLSFFAAPAFGLTYWLENGSVKTPLCPGNTEGRPLKIANGGGDKFLITAIAICTDTGDAYKIRFDFLSVRINPAQVGNIDRPVVDFNWVGLAVYKPANAAGSKVKWLYDEARMIEGSLPRDSSEPVYFGDLEFVVPKAAGDEGTHFTFYLTWKGPLETFGVL